MASCSSVVPYSAMWRWAASAKQGGAVRPNGASHSRSTPAPMLRIASSPVGAVSFSTPSATRLVSPARAHRRRASRRSPRVRLAAPHPPACAHRGSGSRTPPHEDALLVAADRLAPLVLHARLEDHDSAAGLGRLAALLHGHLGVDGVAELHRRREPYAVESEERERRALEPPREVLRAVGDGEREDAVGDARAEGCRLRKLRVRVERVEVARAPGDTRAVTAVHW